MSSSTRMQHLVLAALSAFTAGTAHAGIVISEVDPNGSSASYKADWFELTNTGSTAVDLTGWRMDDDSKSFAASVALRGVSSIAAGQSVVFIETASSGTDTATDAAFTKSWFGATTSAVTIGNYQGSGVGLGANGDSVVIFNTAGTVVASVDFGASSLGTTFDNAAGLNNATLTQQSVAGVRGAFRSVDGVEVGSPGAIASVPEPDGYVLALAGLGALGVASRRRSTRG